MWLQRSFSEPCCLLHYYTLNPFLWLIQTNQGEEKSMLSKKHRWVCMCVYARVYVCGSIRCKKDTSNALCLCERKKEVSSALGLNSSPDLNLYTQGQWQRIGSWLTACHIMTLIPEIPSVFLPVSLAPHSMWWSTAQVSSTKTLPCQAWNPATGEPYTLLWTQSCAKFTVWIPRLWGLKTMGSKVSRMPRLPCWLFHH